MKTATALKSAYIDLIMRTTSKEEHSRLMNENSWIFGYRCNPKRDEQSQRFVEACERCYSGNTVSDLFKKKYGFPPAGKTDEQVLKLTGLTFDELRAEIVKMQEIAPKLILKAFNENQKELNELYNLCI
jgi:hypothetical protein